MYSGAATSRRSIVNFNNIILICQLSTNRNRLGKRDILGCTPFLLYYQISNQLATKRNTSIYKFVRELKIILKMYINFTNYN